MFLPSLTKDQGSLLLKKLFCWVARQVKYLIHNQLKADTKEKLTTVANLEKLTYRVYIPFCNACYRSLISTMIFRNIVSSRTYAWLLSWAREQNIGHPLAMLVSLVGLWKEELLGSGLKASITCSTLSWSSNMKVTFCLNGQRSNASYWPRMTTKEIEMCVPRPMPSPFKYTRAHILYPKRLV